MKVKGKMLGVATACILLFCGCAVKDRTEAAEIPAVTGDFCFTVLKVGKADAIILKTENHCVIIDCGEKDDGEKIADYLAKNEISEVDYIIITHFDKDHVGGFSEAIQNAEVGSVVCPNYDGHNNEYKKFIKILDEGKFIVTRPEEDISFVTDDVLFEVSVPKRGTYAEKDNDRSLVVSVTHGENKFLFAGDAEKERIDEILSEIDCEYDFLKVPHHGRYGENTDKLISEVEPKYSVICDSKKNPADEETLRVLEAAGSQIYRTANGDITVVSDGKEIKISQ